MYRGDRDFFQLRGKANHRKLMSKVKEIILEHVKKEYPEFCNIRISYPTEPTHEGSKYNPDIIISIPIDFELNGRTFVDYLEFPIEVKSSVDGILSFGDGGVSQINCNMRSAGHKNYNNQLRAMTKEYNAALFVTNASVCNSPQMRTQHVGYSRPGKKKKAYQIVTHYSDVPKAFDFLLLNLLTDYINSDRARLSKFMRKHKTG